MGLGEFSLIYIRLDRGICLLIFFGPNCKRFGIKRLEMVSVLGSKVCVFCFVLIKGTIINSVPFRPEWPENIILASKLKWYTPLFHLGTNSGSFRGVPAVSGDFGEIPAEIMDSAEMSFM